MLSQICVKGDFKDVQEVKYKNIIGFQNQKLDDGKDVLIFCLADGSSVKFGIEAVAYVKFD